jgi:NAD dependent epimerase/dehydratase family enzyme
LSWIDLEDLIRMVQHVLARDDTSGPINAVSPRPVTHADFSRALARVLGRPALVRVPGWLLRAVLGEMGRELLLFSQRVVPARLHVRSSRHRGSPASRVRSRHALMTGQFARSSDVARRQNRRGT